MTKKHRLVVFHRGSNSGKNYKKNQRGRSVVLGAPWRRAFWGRRFLRFQAEVGKNGRRNPFSESCSHFRSRRPGTEYGRCRPDGRPGTVGSGTHWDQDFVIWVPTNGRFWPGPGGWLHGFLTAPLHVCHRQRINPVRPSKHKVELFLIYCISLSTHGTPSNPSSLVLIPQNLIGV